MTRSDPGGSGNNRSDWRKRQEFRKGVLVLKQEETRVAIDLWMESVFSRLCAVWSGDCANIAQRGFLKPNVEFLLR